MTIVTELVCAGLSAFLRTLIALCCIIHPRNPQNYLYVHANTFMLLGSYIAVRCFMFVHVFLLDGFICFFVHISIDVIVRVHGVFIVSKFVYISDCNTKN